MFTNTLIKCKDGTKELIWLAYIVHSKPKCWREGSVYKFNRTYVWSYYVCNDLSCELS